MKVLINQTKLEMKLFIRRRGDLFWTLLFPVFFIVLFGLIYGDRRMDETIRAIEYVVPGIIVMAMMTTGILTNAVGFVEERERGIYRRLAVTPLKRQAIIGSQIITKYFIVIAQSIILLVIGMLAWKIQIAGNLGLIWLLVTLGGVCFLTIGFVLTNIIRTTKSATPVALIVFFMLLFLGGLFFPVDLMPDGISFVSDVLPSTHLNNAFRKIVIEGAGIGDIGINLLVITAWTVVCSVVSVRFFRWE